VGKGKKRVVVERVISKIYSCVRYHGETPLKCKYSLKEKDEGQECITGPVWGWVQVGGARMNGVGEGG
jgi:hypothetical protein